MNRILSLIFKTSTDGILSTFTKTIAKLETHATAEFDRSERLKANAERTYQQSAAALAESAKAKAASQKLTNLFKE